MFQPVSLTKLIKISSFWLHACENKPPFLCQNQMEHKLQKIWEIAQGTSCFPSIPAWFCYEQLLWLLFSLLFWMFPGQSIDMLDFDSVQDLSLLLDSPDSVHTLRKLGLSLGVPPQVTAHLHSFQDLFLYLRTSTYTQLPQLAQAAALLPSFEVVSRIHKAVVNQLLLTPWGHCNLMCTKTLSSFYLLEQRDSFFFLLKHV